MFTPLWRLYFAALWGSVFAFGCYATFVDPTAIGWAFPGIVVLMLIHAVVMIVSNFVLWRRSEQ